LEQRLSRGASEPNVRASFLDDLSGENPKSTGTPPRGKISTENFGRTTSRGPTTSNGSGRSSVDKKLGNSVRSWIVFIVKGGGNHAIRGTEKYATFVRYDFAVLRAYERDRNFQCFGTISPILRLRGVGVIFFQNDHS